MPARADARVGQGGTTIGKAKNIGVSPISYFDEGEHDFLEPDATRFQEGVAKNTYKRKRDQYPVGYGLVRGGWAD